MVLQGYAARKKDPELPVLTNLPSLWYPGAPVQHITGEETMTEALDKLLHFERGMLLLDEAGVFLNSRMWSKMPPELTWKWQQLRKDRIELRWTCIAPNMVVKDLRDITFETHYCQSFKRVGFFLVSHYSYTKVGDKRFFMSRSLVRFQPKLLSQLYDTYGKVRSLSADRAGQGSALADREAAAALTSPAGGMLTPRGEG